MDCRIAPVQTEWKEIISYTIPISMLSLKAIV